MGSRRDRDAEWIEHQDAFNQLLAGLNAVQGQGRESPCTDPLPEPATGRPGKTLVENAMEAKKIVLVYLYRAMHLWCI